MDKIIAHRAVLFLLAFIAAMVLTTHHTLPPIDRDEARFAQSSRQMHTSGDYITPYVQDDLRAKKPIGIYWLQASSAIFFDPDKMATYRLPSLLALLLTLVFVWRAAPSFGITRLEHRLLAIGLLGSNVLVFAEAVLAKSDAALLAACCAMQFCLWSVYRTRNDAPTKSYTWLGFWVALAVGVLIKGPISLLLAFTTLAGLALVDRNIGWWRTLRPWYGIAIFFALVLPWYIAVSVATDGVFLQRAFLEDFAPKIASGQESHGAPFGTYLVTLTLFLFPASLFLFPVFGRLRTLWREEASRFLCVWIIGFWLVFEMTPTKLPHYVMPTYPALCLLMVRGFIAPAFSNTHWNWRNMLMPLGVAINVLVATLLLYALYMASVAYMERHDSSAFLAVGYGSICISFAVAFYIWLHHRSSLFAIVMFLIFAVSFQSALHGVLSSWERAHLAPRIVRSLATHQIPQTTPIIVSGYSEPSLVFLRGGGDGLAVRYRTAEAAAQDFAQCVKAGKDALALIDTRKDSRFRDTLATHNISPAQIGRVAGFNYAQGRELDFAIYRVQ